ncbi:hypothetical protein ILYODFUR_038605 [Ilyodon furcidens]|uniref:Uncharacterized protein n=1 Tax=Ilyodon furcidens TaxID=33524 RepID=A0ABV0VKP1_9TELE
MNQQTSNPSATQPSITWPIQPTTSSATQPPTASAIQFSTNVPPKKEAKNGNNEESRRECSHMVGGQDEFYPVKRVLKTKMKKGNQMELVEWEPCSLCGKTWPPQWVAKENTKI